MTSIDAFAAASELIDAYRDQTLTPVEAVEACIDRIRAVDSDVRALAAADFECARDTARKSQQRWAEGHPRPLEGVPFLVKDIIATAGLRTTGGSRVYDDHVPDVDAMCVSRLRAAGAILLGKAQTYEFAAGSDGHGNTEAWPSVRNPWDLKRTSGGSSSGSAAAVAAGYAPLALGSDTAGSIREPAAFCGVTAIKPTYGRVSRRGVMASSWTLDHVGLFARAAKDLALSLGSVSGHEHGDHTASTHATVPYREPSRAQLDGLRVGIPTNWFWDDVDRQVAEATRAAADVLESVGARVTEVEVSDVGLCEAVGWTILSAEFGSLHEDHIAEWELYGLGNRETLPGSIFVSASDYLRALRLRSVVMAGFEAAFEKVDLLLTPGAAQTAPKLGAAVAQINGADVRMVDTFRMYWPANVAGLPAVCLPAGTGETGLPVGVQLLGRPFAEHTLLSTAVAFQSATDHHLERPRGGVMSDAPADGGQRAGSLPVGGEATPAGTALIHALANRRALDPEQLDVDNSARFDGFLAELQRELRRYRLDYLDGPEPSDALAWIEAGGRFKADRR